MLGINAFDNRIPRISFICDKFEEQPAAQLKKILVVFLSILSKPVPVTTVEQLAEECQLKVSSVIKPLRKLIDRKYVIEDSGVFRKNMNLDEYVWMDALPCPSAVADRQSFHEIVRDVKRRYTLARAREASASSAELQGNEHNEHPAEDAVVAAAIVHENIPEELEIKHEDPPVIDNRSLSKEMDVVEQMKTERAKMMTNTLPETNILKRKLCEIEDIFNHSVAIHRQFSQMDELSSSNFNKKLKELKSEMLQEPHSHMSTILSETMDILSQYCGFEKKSIFMQCPFCLCAVSTPSVFAECGHIICDEHVSQLVDKSNGKKHKLMECVTCRKLSNVVRLFI